MEKEAVRPEQCMVVGGSCVCKISKTERDWVMIMITFLMCYVHSRNVVWGRMWVTEAVLYV